MGHGSFSNLSCFVIVGFFVFVFVFSVQNQKQYSAEISWSTIPPFTVFNLIFLCVCCHSPAQFWFYSQQCLFCGALTNTANHFKSSYGLRCFIPSDITAGLLHSLTTGMLKASPSFKWLFATWPAMCFNNHSM